MDELGKLDLNEGPNTNLARMEESYHKLLGLCDYNRHDRIPFYTDSFHAGESILLGSLEIELFKSFFNFEIHKHTGMSYDVWLEQPYETIMSQLELIPELLAKRAEVAKRLSDEYNK